jgi:hypothetical protein
MSGKDLRFANEGALRLAFGWLRPALRMCRCRCVARDLAKGALIELWLKNMEVGGAELVFEGARLVMLGFASVLGGLVRSLRRLWKCPLGHLSAAAAMSALSALRPPGGARLINV